MGLRVWSIARAQPNPFYDAAVRSMGLSWHNFFFGALEPAGSVSIDKAPVDLWLQVLSTQALGFNRTALQLPEALGGVAAVGLLYGAVAEVWGWRAATLSALAFAVLPSAVLTSRSDTMDSVMVALLAAALWASLHALRTRRGAWVILAAVLVGLAFNVKLTQALIPVPALALMWWTATRPGRRLRVLGLAGAVLLTTALCWLVIASLTPLRQRPFPIGSHHGSLFSVVLVYNGLERLGAAPTAAAKAGRPGPLRLLRFDGPNFGWLVGLELVGAASMAVAAVPWRPTELAGVLRLQGGARPGNPDRVGALALGIWLATTVLLFSFLSGLQVRYLDTASPALAAILGISAAAVIRRPLRDRPGPLVVALVANCAYVLAGSNGLGIGVLACLLATCVLLARSGLAALRKPGASIVPGGARAVILTATLAVALLAVPTQAAVKLVESNATDASTSGSGEKFSAYLRAHRQGARYETASSDVNGVTKLIVSDAQPVLVLNDVHGPLVPTARLRKLVRDHAVRFLVLRHQCSSGRACPPNIRWSLAHAVKVQAGRGPTAGLYRYIGS